jgi:hypothetical protein
MRELQRKKIIQQTCKGVLNCKAGFPFCKPLRVFMTLKRLYPQGWLFLRPAGIIDKKRSGVYVKLQRKGKMKKGC